MPAVLQNLNTVTGVNSARTLLERGSMKRKHSSSGQVQRARASFFRPVEEKGRDASFAALWRKPEKGPRSLVPHVTGCPFINVVPDPLSLGERSARTSSAVRQIVLITVSSYSAYESPTLIDEEYVRVGIPRLWKVPSSISIEMTSHSFFRSSRLSMNKPRDDGTDISPESLSGSLLLEEEVAHFDIDVPVVEDFEMVMRKKRKSREEAEVLHNPDSWWSIVRGFCKEKVERGSKRWKGCVPGGVEKADDNEYSSG
ncbi:hypothetical protein F5146DRAFT_995351 [Armillaria mellea]|nr:hypothetical protein F5146DRAFT_995351 [Armillaria mellea]